MSDKTKAIRIVSKKSPEFNSNINVGEETYHVQTEDMGSKSNKVISRVYLKGEVVYSRTADYAHLVKLDEFETKLHSLMENQHKNTIDFFIRDRAKKERTQSDYFQEVKQLLRRGNGKLALNTLRQALERYPFDAFLLSYYGCLVAVVENKTYEGIEICTDAIEKLKNAMPFGSEFFFPVFYLNLGRAYLKDNNKKEAMNAFHEGLKHDPENHDLLWEIRKMGSRKKPPIPFLKRNNPVNKYIGIMITKMTK